MSESFYIGNAVSMSEYQTLAAFIKHELQPLLSSKVQEYVKNMQYINRQYIIDEISDISIPGAAQCDAELQRLGQLSVRGFMWDNVSVCDVWIRSYGDLKLFLETHPEYAIFDDCSRQISFPQFVEATAP